jgi:hypothetical protein
LAYIAITIVIRFNVKFFFDGFIPSVVVRGDCKPELVPPLQ